MPEWLTIVIPFATLVIGFLLRILQERILEKKVGLSHRMDGPAVFSDIPPKVCFQTLHIFNRGKLPAKNIRVCLDEESIKNCRVEYKPLTEDDFSAETKESVRILKFERLLPGDSLQISFKSSERLPGNFTAWVKSDEMVSQISRGEEGILSSKITTFMISLAVAFIAMSLYYVYQHQSLIQEVERIRTLEKPKSEKPKPASYEIHLTTDKPLYSKNQPMEVVYRIRNMTGETLGDFLVIMEIPGFSLDYENLYKRKNFLRAQEEFFQKIPVQIPKDIPPGKYKITVKARGEGLDKTLRDEAQTFFEVR